MDDSYCTIQLIDNVDISLYFFLLRSHTSNHPICITSAKAETIYYLISLHKSFSGLSLSHYLYLGRELYKAELCLILEQNYVQN